MNISITVLNIWNWWEIRNRKNTLNTAPPCQYYFVVVLFFQATAVKKRVWVLWTWLKAFKITHTHIQLYGNACTNQKKWSRNSALQKEYTDWRINNHEHILTTIHPYSNITDFPSTTYTYTRPQSKYTHTLYTLRARTGSQWSHYPRGLTVLSPW